MQSHYILSLYNRCITWKYYWRLLQSSHKMSFNSLLLNVIDEAQRIISLSMSYLGHRFCYRNNNLWSFKMCKNFMGQSIYLKLKQLEKYFIVKKFPDKSDFSVEMRKNREIDFIFGKIFYLNKTFRQLIWEPFRNGTYIPLKTYLKLEIIIFHLRENKCNRIFFEISIQMQWLQLGHSIPLYRYWFIILNTGIFGILL